MNGESQVKQLAHRHSLVVRELPYSVDFFNRIPDYWDVKDQSHELESFAPILGEVICQFGLHAVFGISLLHRHFTLNEREKLTRTYTTRRFSVAIGRECGTDVTVPYMWALDDANSGFNKWRPIEFCDETYPVKRAAAKHSLNVMRRVVFFDTIAEKIRELHLERKVALTALFQKDQFDLSTKETLFEETNDQRRLITLRVAKEEELAQATDTIKTLWLYSPSRRLVNAATCASHCYGHCRSHCPPQMIKGRDNSPSQMDSLF